MKLIHCLKIENWKLEIIFIIFILISPSTISAGVIIKPVSSLGLSSGLVGWWAFDGLSISGANVVDKSGNGNAGTITGATKIMGKIGQALSFNGSNQLVSVGTVISPSYITISAWVYRTSSTINQGIVRKESAYALSLYNNTIQVAPGNNWAFYDTSIAVPFNTWKHYVFTYDGSYMKVYVDGVWQWTSTLLSGSLPSNSNATNIGYDDNSWWWGGAIDDVRIYSRALSSTEISKLYNIGVTKINKTSDTSSNDGLVGWWTMDGANISGDTLVDKSSSSNNGTKNSAYHRSAIGKIGQAMEWITEGGAISLTNNSSLSSADHLTLAEWVRLDHYGTYYAVHIMNKWTGIADANYAWYLFGNYLGNGGQGNLGLYANCGGTWQSISAFYRLSEGIWYHLAVTYDSVSGGQLYVNGEPSGAHVASCGVLATSNATANLSMGLGLVDDARIYNRTLSAAEIKKLYNMGLPTKINKSPTNSMTSGLVGYWTFDGSKISGANALDSSGQNNTGTITGATKVIGKIGQGLSCNGNSDGISLPNVAATNTGSYSFWVKPTIISGTYGWIDSNFDIFQWTPSSLYFRAGNQSSVSIATWTPNSWHHVAMTWNGTNYYGFLDGVQVTDGLQSGNRTGVVSLCKVDSSYFYPGSIDDVRIYNRALSVDEVKKLYNSGR